MAIPWHNLAGGLKNIIDIFLWMRVDAPAYRHHHTFKENIHTVYTREEKSIKNLIIIHPSFHNFWSMCAQEININSISSSLRITLEEKKRGFFPIIRDHSSFYSSDKGGMSVGVLGSRCPVQYYSTLQVLFVCEPLYVKIYYYIHIHKFLHRSVLRWRYIWVHVKMFIYHNIQARQCGTNVTVVYNDDDNNSKHTSVYMKCNLRVLLSLSLCFSWMVRPLSLFHCWVRVRNNE